MDRSCETPEIETTLPSFLSSSFSSPPLDSILQSLASLPTPLMYRNTTFQTSPLLPRSTHQFRSLRMPTHIPNRNPSTISSIPTFPRFVRFSSEVPIGRIIVLSSFTIQERVSLGSINRFDDSSVERVDVDLSVSRTGVEVALTGG